MIAALIRQLCAMSILCGAAMSITPEGVVKRVLEVVCSAVLISAVIQPLIGIDFAAYALELARVQEREAQFVESGGDLNDRLNRLVIEERCETYIMDKADELGAEIYSAEVSVQWSMDGFWIPWSVRLGCGSGERGLRELGEKIEAELGIPAERQQWSDDGTSEG